MNGTGTGEKSVLLLTDYQRISVKASSKAVVAVIADQLPSRPVCPFWKQSGSLLCCSGRSANAPAVWSAVVSCVVAREPSEDR